MVENYGYFGLNMLEILTFIADARLVLAICFMLMSVFVASGFWIQTRIFQRAAIFVDSFTVGRKTMSPSGTSNGFPIMAKKVERGLAQTPHPNRHINDGKARSFDADIQELAGGLVLAA